MTAALLARPALGDLERGLLTRAVAMVFLTGLPLAMVWLALPHAQAVDAPALLVVFLAAELVGLLLLGRRLRVPAGLFAAAVALANALIGVAIYLTGVPDSGLELFYVWLTPFAFAFSPLRVALLQSGLAGGGYAAALGTMNAGGVMGRWVLVVGTVVTIGMVLRRLSVVVLDTETRFRLAFEASRTGMALLDEAGRALSVNDTLCRFLGRARDELIGTSLPQLPEADEPVEREFVRRTGEIVHGAVTSSPVQDRDGRPRYIHWQVVDVTSRVREEAERRAQAVILAARVEELELIGEVGELALSGRPVEEVMARAERGVDSLRDPASALPDGVAHVVALALERAEAHAAIAELALQRGWLVAGALAGEDRVRRTISETLHARALQDLLAARQDVAEAIAHPDRRADALARALDGLDQAGMELRSAVFELHPLALHHGGLESALEAIVARQAERRGFAWSVELDAQAAGVMDDLILSVTRELVTNAAKHASATRVSVVLRRSSHELELVVGDDGCGMAPGRARQALRAGHIGLGSIAQRVEAVRGTFSIDSRPGAGTTVIVQLPVHQPDPPIAGFPSPGASPTLHA